MGVFLYGVDSMAKEYAKKFYKGKAWRLCRESFISYRVTVDGGMCEHCKDNLGYIVDHKEEITPENIDDPEITLNHENLQYLCTPCHNRKTFGNGNDFNIVRDGLEFDSNGDLIRSCLRDERL